MVFSVWALSDDHVSNAINISVIKEVTSTVDQGLVQSNLTNIFAEHEIETLEKLYYSPPKKLARKLSTKEILAIILQDLLNQFLILINRHFC